MNYRFRTSGFALSCILIGARAGAQNAAPGLPPDSAAPAPTAQVSPLSPPGQESRSTAKPVSTAPAAIDARPVLAPPIKSARLKAPTLGWDINLDGAYGHYFPGHEGFGFARFRGGLLYSVDPVFYALGLTYDWSNLQSATFGIQAEAMQLEAGLWVQGGAMIDKQAHPGAMFAVGWSVLGVELQYRKFDPYDWGFATVAKLRIPITFIAKALE